MRKEFVEKKYVIWAPPLFICLLLTGMLINYPWTRVLIKPHERKHVWLPTHTLTYIATRQIHNLHICMHRAGSYMNVIFFFFFLPKKLSDTWLLLSSRLCRQMPVATLGIKADERFSATLKSRPSTEYACVRSSRLLPVGRNSEHATYPSCDQKLHTSRPTGQKSTGQADFFFFF